MPNPYHDSSGRFASKGGGGRKGKSNAQRLEHTKARINDRGAKATRTRDLLSKFKMRLGEGLAHDPGVRLPKNAKTGEKLSNHQRTRLEKAAKAAESKWSRQSRQVHGRVEALRVRESGGKMGVYGKIKKGLAPKKFSGSWRLFPKK